MLTKNLFDIKPIHQSYCTLSKTYNRVGIASAASAPFYVFIKLAVNEGVHLLQLI